MRWLALLTLPIAGAIGIILADDAPKGEEVVKDFFVHEWGVWRVHEDVDLANADMCATWEELPPFVYGQTKGREFPRHWEEPTVVKKPVIFFHAPKPVEVDLRVDFPTGTPAVWYPGTINAANYED